MTDTCPSDGELEQFLAGVRSAAGEQPIEAHVAGCRACQQRLVKLNPNGVTLPPWPVNPENARNDTPLPGELLAREGNLTTSHFPSAAGCGAPATNIEAAGQSTRSPAPAGAALPTAERRQVGCSAQVSPRNTEIPTAGAATLPAPPAAYGRYHVQRPLGSGGFGEVYLGHDTQLDRPVAVKVLRRDAGRAQGERERWLQEARRLARLRHPGIVAVHDVGVHEDEVYIVSDFLEGPDLAQWLRDHRPAWPEAARIVALIADALAHLHAQLVVHRDIKPANIILTAVRTPVLVDFGLALDDSQQGGREKGVISGTPWYMSPEQASGTAHRIDGRTDIYSLGVILYEMLTGRLPFRATQTLELLRQVRDDEPQPPRQLVADLPPELERICLKALAKRQQDRYTTATDFAADLRRLLLSAAETGIARDAAISSLPAVGDSPAVAPATPQSQAVTPPSSRRRLGAPERRQVTVLVCGCDLFQSESYLEGLDAEDQAKVLRTFQQVCEPAAQRFGGTVVQCNEQGTLVCFGYPVAYEDGAQRAAQTGLGMLDDLKAIGAQLHREHKLELNLWVGLHTGPAVVETVADGVSLVGEARNVALRLEEAAVPGAVICSEATQRLLQGRFDCLSVGRRKVKGITHPVELFQVQGTAEARGPAEEAALTPLTGRDHEISLLKERWEQAREGMGQVVLIVGEPGLGKSRLVHTLKQHVLEQPAEGEASAPVTEWRCSPHYQNSGLYPAIDFYERALGFGRELSPEKRFDLLLQRLEEYGLARPETVPLWASLLSLPAPDRYPPLALSPVRQREETFQVMLELLHTLAARNPILFVVEDLHWVDASTLEFLGLFLAEGLHDSILTVLTFRPEFQTPWPALPHQTSLALTRLTRRQVGELIRQKAGDALPDALVDQVYDRAGGVPLFVEEFTKMVQESSTLEPAGQGGTPGRMLAEREIPATLQDLVMARLDRMEGERDVAQLAAVLGREFGHDLLSAVATLDETALRSEIAKLVQAEILYQKGRPPRATYIFKHALLEDALYNSLVKSKRQQFHRQIAGALETKFPETVETKPELLAHHFTEAGLVEKAVGYWLKAGQRSRERSALCEAIGHFTRGLALLATTEESRARDLRELEFLTALGPTYITARGYAAPEIGPALVRARALCERIDDAHKLFGVMLGMWEWRIVRAELRLCVDLAADGMALAERLNDPGIMMEALFMPGVTKFYRAEFASARACHEKALAAFDDGARTKFWTAYTGHNASVTHRCYLALALWHKGCPDQALQLSAATCELARTIGHAFSLGHALDFAAYLYHYCRLGAEMEAVADQELALATEQGFQLWDALGALHKGAGLLLQGRREEGLALVQKAYSAFRATGAEVRVPAYLGILGEAYTQAARFADAHQALDEGLAVADKNDNRCHEAELYRLKGELVLAESADQVTAERFLHQAVETARRHQSKAWELRATMSLARLRQQQGRHNDGHAALAAVYDTFTEGFNTPDVEASAALLKALA